MELQPGARASRCNSPARARIPLDILTVGQYLQPTKEHLPVRRFYTPDEFAELRDQARSRGIPYVQSGPLVRSSYRAEEPFESGAPAAH